MKPHCFCLVYREGLFAVGPYTVARCMQFVHGPGREVVMYSGGRDLQDVDPPRRSR